MEEEKKKIEEQKKEDLIRKKVYEDLMNQYDRVDLGALFRDDAGQGLKDILPYVGIILNIIVLVKLFFLK